VCTAEPVLDTGRRQEVEIRKIFIVGRGTKSFPVKQTIGK